LKADNAPERRHLQTNVKKRKKEKKKRDNSSNLMPQNLISDQKQSNLVQQLVLIIQGK
jgi:hypothetical protein